MYDDGRKPRYRKPPLQTSQMQARRCGGVAWLFALLTLVTHPASAGPPFRTDDPQPVELGHWEINAFSAATRTAGDTAGIAAALDVNYGAAPDLQLHAITPSLAFDKPGASGTRFGPGDAELGFKYRIAQEDGWRPAVAIYPAVAVPTGSRSHGLGSGHTRMFLPVWLEKTFGDWTTDAGGGYWRNPGAGNRDFWFAGWLLARRIHEDLSLGAEVFEQSRDRDDGKDQTGFNVGAVYNVSDRYHLLLAVGRGIRNVTTTNEFSYYIGLQWTFGPAQ